MNLILQPGMGFDDCLPNDLMIVDPGDNHDGNTIQPIQKRRVGILANISCFNNSILSWP